MNNTQKMFQIHGRNSNLDNVETTDSKNIMDERGNLKVDSTLSYLFPAIKGKPAILKKLRF
jgi:hypothetical protein